MLVTAINRTNDLVLLGDRYLFPGEGRRVPVNVYREARARYGAGLVAHGELGAPDATIPVNDDGAPDEFSLDVFDGEAADLERLTRPGLVEAARLRGIVPGRMTKRELIDAIQACDGE